MLIAFKDYVNFRLILCGMTLCQFDGKPGMCVLLFGGCKSVSLREANRKGNHKRCSHARRAFQMYLATVEQHNMLHNGQS